mmetsp:Transcript_76829/g.205254  ORF Transcript_76829/g.205254 Transcript_76829/m.205254 type:complete len:392 (-) Transcript_76829:253-1428(-)
MTTTGVEGLQLTDDKKNYIVQTLNPVLDKIVAAALAARPSNTAEWIVEFLEKEYNMGGGGGGGGGEGGKALLAALAGEEEEEEEEEEDDDDDVDELPESFIMKAKTGPRQSVSAAAYGEWNQKKEFTPPVHEKDDATKAKVRELLAGSFMFSALDEKDMSTVVDATEPVKLGPKERVIKQGDDGDFMFIIMDGQLDCYKKFAGEEEEKLVKTCEKGDCFGELALLYNCPRAASVESREACELLKLDSETFTNIVSDGARKKRTLYEEFLKKVKLLSGMDSYERAQVADGLKVETHASGTTVVKEGDPGDKFYIVEEGTAKATKVKGTDEKEVMQYQAGDYFGELALLRNEPRAANVIATSDCKLLTLDRKSFKRLLGPLDTILQRAASEYK